MKGYKAFKKGLVCRDKQYAENTVFEEDKAEVCRSGMHFCKNPLDVFKFYDLVDEDGNAPEFSAVESMDDALTDDGAKYCTKKLKIGTKIGFSDFIKLGVDFEYKSIKDNASSGDYSQLASSGNSSRLASSGDSSRLASSGNGSRLASSGNESQLASSGDYSRLASSGDSSRLASSGNGSCIESTGKNSIICCAGDGSIAKAKIGSWITLSEWELNEKEGYVPICVKTMYVDGKIIKEDTFYELKDGEFEEVR